MSLREHLLRDIEKFVRLAGMSERTFGKAALNDSALVHRIRNGRSPGADTIDAINKFMTKHAPRKKAAKRGKKHNGG